jgi:hypothetical protein
VLGQQTEEFPGMALTPKERADFDEIVMRLRLEDAHLGVVAPKRRPTALLVSLIAAVLVFGLGVALLGQGVLGPILILLAVAGCAALAWRSRVGSRAKQRRPRR